MPNPPVDIAVELGSGSLPLTTQIANQLRQAVASARLCPGDRLPSTRRLAADLGIARGTVTAALDQLLAEGVLETRVGIGTFVSADAVPVPQPPYRPLRKAGLATRPLPTPNIDAPVCARIDLRPCRPATAEFSRTAWRRCLAHASQRQPSPDYGDARGPKELRTAIAEYLRRARGYTVDPADIVITNGSVHAMHLIAATHAIEGAAAIVEDPGYPLARQTFAVAGADIVPCAVDDDGLVVDRLPMNLTRPAVVVVTPSHQFPTGARLSLGRRRHLIDWARRHGALIVEDDYDGEFRYDIAPLPPLAVLADDCVIYCGTFSKTMFPGLRIGFAAGPPQSIAAMARFQALTAYAPGDVVHRALAEFIATGHFERHVHRMRKLYATKRRVVADTVVALGDSARLTGLDSGLNGLLRLTDGRRASQLCRKAAREGVVASSLQHYRCRRDGNDDAIVIGYAEPSVTELEAGLRALLA